MRVVLAGQSGGRGTERRAVSRPVDSQCRCAPAIGRSATGARERGDPAGWAARPAPRRAARRLRRALIHQSRAQQRRL